MNGQTRGHWNEDDGMKKFNSTPLTNEQKRIGLRPHVAVRLMLTLLLLCAHLSWAGAPPAEHFAVTGFSPDSKKLYLEYADTTGKVRIGWMNLATRKVSLFEPQNTQDQLAAASSSSDGKQLAIVIKEAAHNFESSQIGILDLKSNTYRAITHGYAYRQFPSFSRDGKKIIFASPNHIRKNGHTRFSGWDIYEVDVNTGVERALTKYCFFAVTYPFYLGGGDKFIFSGESPNCNYPSPDSPAAFDAYSNKYHENEIFVRDVGKDEPLEPLFQYGKLSDYPFVTRDGEIFFRSSDGYNYDIFTYSKGVIRQLTNLKTYLWSYVVSPRGDLIEYGSDKKRNHHVKQWLMDVKSSKRSKRSEIDFGDSKSFQIIKVIDQFKGEIK